MLHKLLGACAGLMLSAALHAEDSKILAFTQFINPVEKQAYSAAAPAVNPGAQLWSAVYLIAQTNQAPDDAGLEIHMAPQGLLFKNAPAKKADEFSFDAINLAKKEQYALQKYSDLADLIQEQTGKKIEDAPVFDASRARVYARVEEWAPDFNAQSAGLTVELERLPGIEAKGLYILIGEGEKPKDLAALADLDPLLKPQYRTEEAAAKSHGRRELREARWMIWLTVIAVGIFFGWYRRRR